MNKRQIVSNDILKIAAKHHGYFYSYLDKPRNKILKITDKRKFFTSSSKLRYMGVYPTNQRFTYDLFKDKAWTKQILKKHKQKVSRGDYFYLNSSWSRTEPKHSKQSALLFAKKIGYPVFVKPNDGTQGRYASIIYNQTQLNNHLKTMRGYTQIFLIEKVESSPEYRIFLVGGKVMFTYRRERSAVVGDGISPIIDLLNSFHVIPSSFLNSHLRSKKMSLRSILKQGDSLEVSPVANISQGSKITDYRAKTSRRTARWAKELHSVLNTHVIGVDVFAPDGIDEPESFKIIEVNHQPSLVGIWEEGHREKVFEIWGLVFKKYFK